VLKKGELQAQKVIHQFLHAIRRGQIGLVADFHNQWRFLYLNELRERRLLQEKPNQDNLMPVYSWRCDFDPEEDVLASDRLKEWIVQAESESFEEA